MIVSLPSDYINTSSKDRGNSCPVCQIACQFDMFGGYGNGLFRTCQRRQHGRGTCRAVPTPSAIDFRRIYLILVKRIAGPSPIRMHSLTSALADLTNVISSVGLPYPVKVVSDSGFNATFGLGSESPPN